MALRYSGDVEVRVSFDPRSRTYRGSVRDLMQPRLRWSGTVKASRLRSLRTATDPETYDSVAVRLLADAQRWARSRGRRFEMVERRGRPIALRGFQAPCPVGAGR